MKKYLTIKTFAAFAITLLLSAVVFATVNYIVNLGLGTKLNPSVKFKIELSIDRANDNTFENTYTVFDNVNNNAVSWASFDYATLNLLGEGSPLLEDTFTSDSVLKLEVTNLNASEYMSFAVLTGENSPITADPEIGLVNIEKNGGSGEITIKNQSIITSDFLIAVDGSKYDTEVERSTVSATGITATLSNSTYYIGYDYVTYLTTADYDVVDVKSVTIGETLLNPNEHYVYDSATGKLKVFASDLTGAVSIECIGKNKKVNVTLTLENCTATYQNQTYNDLTTTTIENISSTKDFVLNFEGNNTTQTAWAFDIHETNLTQIHNYTWEITDTAKTLTIPKEVLTTDIVIEASVGEAWSGTIAAELPTPVGNTYSFSTPSQMAKLAKVVNSGTTFEGKTIELTEGLYLNDELFQFSEKTALVKITDANLGNIIYVGTGLTPSNKNVAIDGALNTATIAGTYYVETSTNTFITAVEGTHYWLSTTADGTEQVYYHTTGSAISTLDMWEPIGKRETASGGYVFKGGLDSNQNKILGLFINNVASWHVGFFGTNSGVVKNLCVETGCVLGLNRVSGISAINSISSGKNCFFNCINKATLVAKIGVIGGVCGFSILCDFINCSNHGNIIIGNQMGGGICSQGYAYIINCYNTGNIYSADGYTAGGIAGYLGTSENDGIRFGTMLNCYNIGKIIASGSKGGLIGIFTHGYVNNCYYSDSSLKICGSSANNSNCVIGDNVCTFDENLTLSKTVAIGFENSASENKVSTKNLLTALNEGAEYINCELGLYDWVLNDAGLPVFGSNLVTTERTYTINFDCSFITNINGSGDSLISNYNGGVKSSEYLPWPTTINSTYKNSGYYFKGWSLNADGSGVLYPYIPPNMTNGSTITLYGVWWKI